jgi:hypothetical protein
MNCLHSVDRAGWRALGLDDVQLARVQLLQLKMSLAENALDSMQALLPDGKETIRADRSDLGGTGTITPQDGNTPGKTALGGVDHALQHDLSEILSGEQLASLGRMCNRETGTQGTP